MRWICSDGGSPSGSPQARGRSKAEPLDGFPGERGVIYRARSRSALGHPSTAGVSASLSSSTPMELRAYGNQELSPVQFEPRGNNSYLSLWKVVDFPTLGSWVLIKKQQGKKPPTSDNVKYLKPPHCTFFQKSQKTCFLFLSRKNIIGEYLYGCTSA